MWDLSNKLIRHKLIRSKLEREFEKELRRECYNEASPHLCGESSNHESACSFDDVSCYTLHLS